MSRHFLTIFIVIISLNLIACSGKRSISIEDPEPQSSAKIILTDGNVKEGIILKRSANELFYIDAKTHKKERLDTGFIREIVESDYVYDFAGNPIPDSEISEYKSMTKTLLYGAGGLILGSAIGVGAGIAIVSSDSTQTGAANTAIGVFGILGAWYFGSVGADQEYDDAVFEARKARYMVEKKKMDEEKRKLEELKKEKQRLLDKAKKKGLK